MFECLNGIVDPIGYLNVHILLIMNVECSYIINYEC